MQKCLHVLGCIHAWPYCTCPVLPEERVVCPPAAPSFCMNSICTCCGAAAHRLCQLLQCCSRAALCRVQRVFAVPRRRCTGAILAGWCTITIPDPVAQLLPRDGPLQCPACVSHVRACAMVIQRHCPHTQMQYCWKAAFCSAQCNTSPCREVPGSF